MGRNLGGWFMFGAARWVVRHKILVIGAGAIGFLFFSQGGDERKSVSPWGSESAQQAAVSHNTPLSEKAFGAVAGAAKDYAGVDISAINPAKLQKSTTENWQSAADAAKRANGN